MYDEAYTTLESVVIPVERPWGAAVLKGTPWIQNLKSSHLM
jgi:hypothetical protein